jgi:hypothetical protein
MVDEYQDTNVLQARIALLVSERHRNLMVVGDDMQSIYAFRGAHHRNILDFPNIVPGTRVFTLSTNYRSTPPVLSFANAIVRGARHGFKRDLSAMRSGGEAPEVVQIPDDKEESVYVAEAIVSDIEAGVPPAEIAALYRAHSHSLRLQTEPCGAAFVRSGRSSEPRTKDPSPSTAWWSPARRCGARPPLPARAGVGASGHEARASAAGNPAPREGFGSRRRRRRSGNCSSDQSPGESPTRRRSFVTGFTRSAPRLRRARGGAPRRQACRAATEFG